MPGNHATGTLGILSSSEMDRDIAAHNGVYGWMVQSGAVTFSSVLTFNVAAVAIGDCVVNSVTNTAAYAGSTVTLGAQDATNPRIDVVVITSGGAVSVVAGTPKALTATSGPVPTAPSSSQLEIARIYVPASGTSLTSANITDRRVPLVMSAFDSIRNQFRSNRRLLAEYSAAPATAGGAVAGVGFQLTPVDASDLVTHISGEPVQRFSVATAAGPAGLWNASTPTASPLAMLSPNHSPRMLCRVQLPAASANVTRWFAGFTSVTNSNTPDGAFLRIITTGNTEFVTRQGGSETAVSLGALSRTTVLGFEIESPDAGVTWICRNQAGTVLAAHTTNVPTAATALIYGVWGTTATGAVPWSVAYARFEGTFA